MAAKVNRSRARDRLQITSLLGRLFNSAAIQLLDLLLLISTLPVDLWLWITANDRLIIVLKTVIEVSLELVTWVVFAGVSVLMTVAFIMDDLYLDNEHAKIERDSNESETINADTEIPTRDSIETR